MVRGGDDGDEDPGRICDSEEDVEEGPGLGLALLARFQGLAEDACVVDHCAADAEGVAKVHGWHGCQGVDVFPLHPHGLPVVVAHAVEESVLWG